MGCFLACFGTSKDRKRRKSRHKRNAVSKPVQSAVSSKHNNRKTPSNPVSETRGFGYRDAKPEKQLNISPQNKVTFDSVGTAYSFPKIKHIPVEGSAKYCVDKEDGGKRNGKDENLVVKPNQSQSSYEDSSIASSSRSYPSNHRYHNCRESDDDFDYRESGVYNDDDKEEEEDEDVQDDEILKSGSKVFTEEPGISSLRGKEVKPNPSARNRSGYMHSVLNPIENFTRWEAVKAKGTPSKQQKENHTPGEDPRISLSPEPSFRESSLNSKAKSEQSKKSSQESPVEASLSDWLVSSDSTPINKTSTTSLDTVTPEKSTLPQRSSSLSGFEDRPILGALTVEELKQFSVSSSPRRSPGHGPDERPIIGTVGTYWSHTDSSKDSLSGSSSFKGIPNAASKYTEDKIVNWHTTPFEIRLERALNDAPAGPCQIPTSNVHQTILR